MFVSRSEWQFCFFDGDTSGFVTKPLVNEGDFSFLDDFKNKTWFVVSKDLPLVHLSGQDDEMVSGLPSFMLCQTYKENWIPQNIFCYFGIKPIISARLSGHYQFQYGHYSGLLNDFWLDYEDVFHVDFEYKYMHVYIKRKNKFLFYNKLIFENEADVHYNLSMIQKEVLDNEVNPEMIFSGEMDKDSRVLKTLKNYYSEIRFLNEKKTEFVINNQVADILFFDKYLMLYANYKRTI
ncbi:MAG: DUF3822 family protein [Saprospiraceae bacterium]|nr:DUF3822 family protein [Saprospiraceae bacterium]